MKVSLVVAAVFMIAVAQADYYCVTQTDNGTQTAISKSTTHSCRGATAWGEYSRMMNRTGWNVLTIETNASHGDFDQSYAAGYLEGYASAEDILNFYHNMLGPVSSFGPVNSQISDWLEKSWSWAMLQAEILRYTSQKWGAVYTVLQQIQGIADGVAAAGHPEFTRRHVFENLALPDIVSDLETVFSNNSKKTTALQRTHCSSIVKVTDDFQDLLFGHTTWMNFNMMLRVFKTVTFNFNMVDISAKTIQYSSYPGMISSTDDFYSLSSGFGVMETSLSIYNKSLYSVLTPHSLISGIRAMVANRMARSGSEWAEYFGFQNSGTYNNQWMIVNMNLFTPGKDLKPGTLYIVEQLPGIIDAKDQTTVLSYGYWPSFNIPSSPRLWELAGYAPHAITDPAFNDYQMNVRAQLFRKLQPSITDVDSLKHVLQYNHYQTDPIEAHNPLWAIASRGDLLSTIDPNQGPPMAFGAIDCKITSYRQMMHHNYTVHAWSGPTPQQMTFDFATTNATQANPHRGLPTVYNFTWQTFKQN